MVDCNNKDCADELFRITTERDRSRLGHQMAEAEIKKLRAVLNTALVLARLYRDSDEVAERGAYGQLRVGRLVRKIRVALDASES